MIYSFWGPTRKGEFFVSRISGVVKDRIRRGVGRTIKKTTEADARRCAEGMRRRDGRTKAPVVYIDCRVPIKGLDY